MKKTSILALALMAAFALASCNRQEIDPPQEGVQGKYLLTEITAYTGDDDTKTAIQSSGVVNWTGGDQIAVIGTDGAIHYYKIKYGAGTPVGKFLPAPGQTPASYNQLSDLTAIYPACTAELLGGELYVNINNLDLSGSYASRGASSWTELSPYLFTNNDIKVAVPSATTSDANGKLNFKFKQLATLCRFLFDFTQADIAPTLVMESIERIRVSTLEGAPIAGRAKVIGTNLGEVSSPKTLVDVMYSAPIAMSSAVEFVTMMYPVVTTNTTLQISVTTTDHEFVFTGKPTQDFEEGKSFSFPVTVDKNFTVGGTRLAYTSSARTDVDQFYYYGGTNCLLIPTTNTFGYLDVTQYVTDSRWHNTKNKSDVLNPRPAIYAKIIWSEGSDVIANEMVDGSNGYKLKLPNSDAGAADAISTDYDGKSILTIKRGTAAGNALVGIYDGSNKLLWSYHIWCPLVDPTDGMYQYTKTNTGTYTVMTMPIGAMKKASLGMANPEQAVGLFYQWGRKDPLGRPSNLNNGDVYLVNGPDQTTALNVGDPENSITGGNLKDCEIWLSNTNNTTDPYNVLRNAWNNDSKGMTISRYMLDYTISKPWMFIMSDDRKDFFSFWMPLDDWLWGNGESYGSFPLMEDTYKSIFDPSPEGYRVAPQDLFLNFAKSGNADGRGYSGEAQAEFMANNFNVTSLAYEGANSASGYSFYYQDWKTGPTDFVLFCGRRQHVSGNFVERGFGSLWTSNVNVKDRGRFVFSSTFVLPLSGIFGASGLPVRCVKEQ